MKDYYEILGITEEEKQLTGDAFNDVCKKKYRAAALKYHPDRWANSSPEERKKAEDKFKEIAEANEVLSNPQKRQQYDMGGSDFDMGGIDPMEIFRRAANAHFGSGFGGGFGFDIFGNGNQMRKGTNVEVEVEITLPESYNGCRKEITINKSVKCSYCNGTGSSDGRTHKCQHCGGRGFISQARQINEYQRVTTSTPCPYCKGSGVDKSASRCTRCNGTGYETRPVKEIIDIPRGIGDNMAYVIEGLGNEPEGQGMNGDLIVKIKVKMDDYFKRVDMVNVVHYEEVPFNEAILGFKRTIKCVDGSEMVLNAHELTKPEQTFFFKGKGFPDPNNPSVVGDYAVVIKYKLPDRLTEKQKKALKEFND